MSSHHNSKRLAKKEFVTEPHPKKDLPIGVVDGILKPAGLNSLGCSPASTATPLGLWTRA